MTSTITLPTYRVVNIMTSGIERPTLGRLFDGLSRAVRGRLPYGGANPPTIRQARLRNHNHLPRPDHNRDRIAYLHDRDHHLAHRIDMESFMTKIAMIIGNTYRLTSQFHALNTDVPHGLRRGSRLTDLLLHQDGHPLVSQHHDLPAHPRLQPLTI